MASQDEPSQKPGKIEGLRPRVSHRHAGPTVVSMREPDLAAHQPKPPKEPKPPKPVPRSVDPAADDPMADQGQAPLELIVERMAGVGLNSFQIAKLIDLPHAQVERDYAHHLEIGKAKANLKVANVLFQTACDPKHTKHTTAAIFFLKARAGWTDRPPDEGSASGDSGADANHFTDRDVSDRFEATLTSLRNR